MMNRLRHHIEAGFIYALYAVFRPLPVDAASALGGWLGRTIGMRLGATRKAYRNLARALPELTRDQQTRIIRDMWTNLGRVIAEYAHLKKFDQSRVEVVNPEYFLDLKKTGRPLLLVSGHFANWEIMPVTAAFWGVPVQLIYRHANNPYADRFIKRRRTEAGGQLARKGVEGARSAHGALQRGGTVGMLIDQKHNRGRPIPFFGRPAMTGTAVAELALRYNAPIVFAHIERLKGAHFRLTITPPLEFAAETPVEDILLTLNQRIEAWVRYNPSQWLWLHRRWPD